MADYIDRELALSYVDDVPYVKFHRKNGCMSTTVLLHGCRYQSHTKENKHDK